MWSAERVVADNLRLRADLDLAGLCAPFEPLLFFADAGNGDQFAFAMRDRSQNILVWDHETGDRVTVAKSLAEFLHGWLTGRIRV